MPLGRTAKTDEKYISYVTSDTSGIQIEELYDVLPSELKKKLKKCYECVLDCKLKQVNELTMTELKDFSKFDMYIEMCNNVLTDMENYDISEDVIMKHMWYKANTVYSHVQDLLAKKQNQRKLHNHKTSPPKPAGNKSPPKLVGVSCNARVNKASKVNIGVIGNTKSKGKSSDVGATDNSSEQPRPIINEVLCFIANKINLMPRDIVQKLCSDFYDESVIDEAKKTLYGLDVIQKMEGIGRLKTRKGNDKKDKDISDIIDTLLVMDSTCEIQFVAKDLANLPPLSYNHFDLAGVIRDIEVLKNELQLVKSGVHLSQANSSVCISDKDIQDIHHLNVATVNSLSHDVSVPHTTDIVLQNSNSNEESSSSGNVNNSAQLDAVKDIGSDTTELKWTEVVKRPRRKPVFGSRNSGQLKVVAKKTGARKCTGIFVSRLSPETEASTVANYVKDTIGYNVSPVKLKTRFGSYSSFAIRCAHEVRVKLLVPDIWEEGVIVRGYYEVVAGSNM